MQTIFHRALAVLRRKVQVFVARHFVRPGSTTLDGALARISRRGLEIGTVIDVGASNGLWSEVCLHYFPAAFYFLIEAQQPHEPKLKRFKNKHPRSEYLLSAAGDTNGEIYFDSADLFGGLASKVAQPGQVVVPVTTVDEQVRSRQLAPPFLLKLDTHGFEIPIFEGASETLRQTALIVVETYNFQLGSTALRFPDMCDYLESKGFRCVDMSDPLYRPLDQAFWQFDLYFMPQDHPIFAVNAYA